MVDINANNINSKKQITLSAADEMYIDTVENKLTMFRQLPYTVPRLMVIENIKSAARAFYRQYYNAIHDAFVFLDLSDIKKMSEECFHVDYNQGFRGHLVRLHPSIRVVTGVYETNLQQPQTVNDVVQQLAWGVNPQYYGQSLIGINNNLYITEYTCKMVEITAMQNIFGDGVPFDYNPLTHMFSVYRDVKHNLVLKCERDIPLQNLYNDELFDRYVMALCKISLRTMVGSHTMNLPGEVTVDIENLCYGADSEKDKVEEILKAGSGLGDIILFR